MKPIKVFTFALSSVLAVGCALATGNAAQASKLLSGVALPGGSAKGSSTFVAPDPAYGLYSSFLINTLKTGKVGAGVNLPTLNNGNDILPNVGKFNDLLFYYEVSNLGPNADPGLGVVIQTQDGFTRYANPTSNTYASLNNYNIYQVDLTPSQFTPSFNTNQTRLRTWSIRYNGSIGPIYVFYPFLDGQNGTLGPEDFNYKTTPDSKFNN